MYNLYHIYLYHSLSNILGYIVPEDNDDKTLEVVLCLLLAMLN